MQDSQRRTLIFSVLDDMKSEGEKITAQKLAAQAKMGKQTVLPYYREWQELEILGEDDSVELSADLIRVLKREIAKEKFRQGEQAREMQDQLDDERDHYAAQSEVWRQQLDEAKASLELESKTRADLEEKLETISREKQSTDQRCASLTERLEHQAEQLASLEEKLVQEAARAEKNLAEQERRLDEAHTKIIDHWMKVIDEERREKGRLNKALEKNAADLGKSEKGRTQCESLLAAEKAAHANTFEEVKGLQQKEIASLQDQKTLHKLQLVLGDEPEKAARELVNESALLKEKEKELAALEKENAELASQGSKVAETERENRKLTEQVIRLEARLEGIQMAGAFRVEK
ncbi:hypothetical protein [Parendozoicomonas sp. Alg238-R29]|uniref:hypothetical protein n=1 Tax=Parendozoicomonas sp. Alg238-R29 TaxID=2993446 RepID=UPI00248D661E|nr:hypothetical protein [Parendozoicomonas sp. Alg238-R29]